MAVKNDRIQSGFLTCPVISGSEVGRQFVGGAQVAVARVALVDRAVRDVVGVLDQAQVAGVAILQRY